MSQDVWKLFWHSVEHVLMKCHNMSASMCCGLVGLKYTSVSFNNPTRSVLIALVPRLLVIWIRSLGSSWSHKAFLFLCSRIFFCFISDFSCIGNSSTSLAPQRGGGLAPLRHNGEDKILCLFLLLQEERKDK